MLLRGYCVVGKVFENNIKLEFLNGYSGHLVLFVQSDLMYN